MKHSELFARAREEMAGRGLAKGAFTSSAGISNVCTLQAMALAKNPDASPGEGAWIPSATIETFLYANGVVRGETFVLEDAINWNSRPERTHLEVVVAFEKAHLYALELEARGELGEV
jgi:hypothetical protein